MRGSAPVAGGRQRSPSVERNREPILAVLTDLLPQGARVLEIASGSGEHALHFAKARADLDWRPSDPDAAARASITAWIAEAGVANVAAPVALDASAADWGLDGQSDFDAVVSINMIHIAPWEACLGLLAGAARALKPGGVLFLYGPFRREGVPTAPSNEAFDQNLKSRDPRWGLRDLGEVAANAAAHGFSLETAVEMPANNHSVVFRKA